MDGYANTKDEDLDIIEKTPNNSTPNYSPIRSSGDSRKIDISPVKSVLPILDRPPKYYGQIKTDRGYLRSVNEIPYPYRNLFSNYPFFNRVQSEVMDDVLYSDCSLVVSAPTGSGKTTIFELAIIRLMLTLQDANYTGDFKIIYIAPVKALCSERLCDWHQKFIELGLSCIEVTGDTDRLEFKNIENYNIIITTPEKWDSITRKWREHRRMVQVVKLFLIDEIHLLNDKKRGPTLEAIVSRMKTIQKTVELELSEAQFNDPVPSTSRAISDINFLTHIRFIATSATISNIEDIGEWLQTERNRTVTRKFSEDYRPVTLQKVVLGYPCPPNTSPYKFDLILNYKLSSIIEQYSNNKPTLVFCTTRKGIPTAAELLAKSLTFSFTSAQREQIETLANQITDPKLRQMLLVGIGWHHAGLQGDDRAIIETLFKSALLPVLLTTSTLSMGVNLPAHLVIIKSTECYGNGGFHNYNEIVLQQMIGRAGRPQYDSFATAVVMTRSDMKKYYEDMITGSEIVESNLHKHLGEHLNSEVVLRTITDLFVAMDWLKTTFLYVRILKNPKYYNFQPNWTKNKIEDKLIEMCQIEINKLKAFKLVETNDEMGVNLKPTRNGELMAQYHLSFETIRLFLQLEGKESIFQLLSMICESDEFSDVCLRVNDKRVLNTLNRNKFVETIRFQLPGRISTRAMKVNCLIQAIFGSLPIQEVSLKMESENILRTGQRISSCLCQYLKEQSKSYIAFRNALTLAKCFNAKLWENSLYVAQQLPKIGPVTAKLLVEAEKTSFDSILKSNPRDLERIMNRGPPLGNRIIEYVQHIPQYSMTINPPDFSTATPRFAIVTVKIINASKIKTVSTLGKNHVVHILVGDTENNILFYQRICDEEIVSKNFIIKQVQLKLDCEHELYGHVISDAWVGIDVKINKKMPPISKYLINTFKKNDMPETEYVNNVTKNQETPNTLNEKVETIEKINDKTPKSVDKNKGAIPKQIKKIEKTCLRERTNFDENSNQILETSSDFIDIDFVELCSKQCFENSVNSSEVYDSTNAQKTVNEQNQLKNVMSKENIFNDNLMRNTFSNETVKTPIQTTTPQTLYNFEFPEEKSPPTLRLSCTVTSASFSEHVPSLPRSELEENDVHNPQINKKISLSDNNLFEIGRHFMDTSQNAEELQEDSMYSTFNSQSSPTFRTLAQKANTENENLNACSSSSELNVEIPQNVSRYQTPENFNNTNLFVPSTPIVSSHLKTSHVQDCFEIKECQLPKGKKISTFRRTSSTNNLKDLNRFVFSPKKAFATSTPIKKAPSDDNQPKVLKVQRVNYPLSFFTDGETSSTFQTPLSAKSVSWRSPLTSEKNISTTTSSGSGSSSINSSMFSNYNNPTLTVNAGTTPTNSKNLMYTSPHQNRTQPATSSTSQKPKGDATAKETSTQYSHPLLEADCAARAKSKQEKLSKSTQMSSVSCESQSTTSKEFSSRLSKDKLKSLDNKSYKVKSQRNSFGPDISHIIYQFTDAGAREAERLAQKTQKRSAKVVYAKISDIDMENRLQKQSKLSKKQFGSPTTSTSEPRLLLTQKKKIKKFNPNSSTSVRLGNTPMAFQHLEETYEDEKVSLTNSETQITGHNSKETCKSEDNPFINLEKQSYQKRSESEKTYLKNLPSNTLKRVLDSDEHYPRAKSPLIDLNEPYFDPDEPENRQPNSSQTNIFPGHSTNLYTKNPLNRIFDSSTPGNYKFSTGTNKEHQNPIQGNMYFKEELEQLSEENRNISNRSIFSPSPAPALFQKDGDVNTRLIFTKENPNFSSQPTFYQSKHLVPDSKPQQLKNYYSTRPGANGFTDSQNATFHNFSKPTSNLSQIRFTPNTQNIFRPSSFSIPVKTSTDNYYRDRDININLKPTLKSFQTMNIDE